MYGKQAFQPTKKRSCCMCLNANVTRYCHSGFSAASFLISKHSKFGELMVSPRENETGTPSINIPSNKGTFN